MLASLRLGLAAGLLLRLLPRCSATVAYAFHATSEQHIAAVVVNAKRLQRWAPSPMDVDYVVIVPSAARLRIPPMLTEWPYSPLPGPAGYYRESMAKLLIYKMVRYARVVYMDADALVLRTLHHLFELPSAPLASALAYWENENCFTGALLVVEPDETMHSAMMRRAPAIVHEGRTEMDLLNRFFEHRLGARSKTFPRVLMLPGTTLVLSSHFLGRKHAYRSDQTFGAPLFDDLDALAEGAAIVHFSGDAKPWQRSRSYWEKKAQRAASPHYLRFVVEFLNEYENALRPSTITVCIPAIREDVATLDAVLSSVDAQTQQPDEIVVYFTGVAPPPAAAARAPLRVFSEARRRTSGYSRNRCMERASSAFVMFVDADDQLHPSRVRIVRGYLESGHTLVLHGHSDFYAAEHLDPRVVGHNDLVASARATSPRAPLLPGSTSGVTHGHPIVATSLGLEFLYEEGYHGGEDAEFLHRVLLSGKAAAVFLPAKLTIVSPRGAGPPNAKHVCPNPDGQTVVLPPAQQRPRGPWACRIFPLDTGLSLCASVDSPRAITCVHLALF